MYVAPDDVNVHLPIDKISMDDANLVQWDRDAGRIIRGYLATYFAPTVIATWDTPEHTPELIRAIAGRLIAAGYYASRFSEEETDYPQYAQKKYDEATNMLMNIQGGRLQVEDISGIALVAALHSLSEDDFWPNDDTDRAFSMGLNF